MVKLLTTLFAVWCLENVACGQSHPRLLLGSAPVTWWGYKDLAPGAGGYVNRITGTERDLVTPSSGYIQLAGGLMDDCLATTGTTHNVTLSGTTTNTDYNTDQTFTVTTWVMVYAAAATGGFENVIGGDSIGAVGNSGWALFQTPTTGAFAAYAEKQAIASKLAYVTNTVAWNAYESGKQWVFLAYMQSGNSVQCYANGTMSALTAMGFSGGTTKNSWTWSRSAGTFHYARQKHDNTQLFRRHLTLSELNNMYYRRKGFVQ